MSMGGEGCGHVDTPENVNAAFEAQAPISSPTLAFDTNMAERSLISCWHLADLPRWVLGKNRKDS